MAWTDERLDDMSRRMDAGFERLERRLECEIRELRAELKTDLGEMRTAMNRAGGGIVVGLLVAILTNGI